MSGRRGGLLFACVLGSVLLGMLVCPVPGMSGSPPFLAGERCAERAWPVGEEMVADLVLIRLAASSSLAQADLSVRFARGIVTLEGIVPTEAARQRAICIALWTPGVQEVRDELVVDPTSSRLRSLPEVDDELLGERVARVVAAEVFPAAHIRPGWRSGLTVEGDGWEMHVAARGGELLLMGRVPEFRNIPHAVSVARLVAGVRTVRTHLYVTGPDASARYSPYGPFDPRSAGSPADPHRPGFGYYGPYPPPGQAGTAEYPSPVWLPEPR